MRNNTPPQAEQYIVRNRHRRIWQKVVGSIACGVVFITTYMLILPAITMEQTAYCGFEEHRHESECFEKRIVCGCEAEEPHIHTSDCSEELQVLTCSQQDMPSHSQDQDCMLEQRTLVCTEDHGHSDDCYEITESDICSQNDTGHIHSE